MIILALLVWGQPDKNNNGNKGNKEQREQGNSGKGNKEKGKGNDQSERGKGNPHQSPQKENKGNSDNRNSPKDKYDQYDQDRSKQNRNKGNGGNKHDDDKSGGNNGHDSKANEKGNSGKGKYKTEKISLWDHKGIDWGFNNFADRRHPKKNKKVTICHHTGNDGYPVVISVSENALKAHLNHGDERGDCQVTYSDRWDRNYIEARQNVYTRYEETWENMSYGEALLKYAVERLTGVRTDLNSRRSSYSADDIQRRENLILDLQNNVSALESQLAVTEQRMGLININVQL